MQIIKTIKTNITTITTLRENKMKPLWTIKVYKQINNNIFRTNKTAVTITTYIKIKDNHYENCKHINNIRRNIENIENLHNHCENHCKL